MIRTSAMIALLVASMMVAPSLAFVSPVRMTPARSAFSIQPLSATKSKNRRRKKDDKDENFLDKAFGMFQPDKKEKEAKSKNRGRKKDDKEENFLDKAFGMFQPDKKEKEEENAFLRQQAAAKATLKETWDSMTKKTASDEEGDVVVDEHLLNRLRVHAEKILSDDQEALELLGGDKVEMGEILSSGPSTIVVNEGRQTDGIRAFIEAKGSERTGRALMVGDRRGVLLLKLTVGGTTLDVKMEEGLDEHLAHGVKKLRP